MSREKNFHSGNQSDTPNNNNNLPLGKKIITSSKQTFELIVLYLLGTVWVLSRGLNTLGLGCVGHSLRKRLIRPLASTFKCIYGNNLRLVLELCNGYIKSRR